MPHELVTCLIAVAVNLAGMVVIYSGVSHFLARLTWGRSGMALLILLIVVSQLFWVPLAMLTATENGFVSYSAWFGNWLVTGFALVLLQRKTLSIPKSLEGTARLDGLGAMGTWRHVVLPFVRRDLMLLAGFLLMGTLTASWYLFHFPDDTSRLVVILQRTDTLRQHLIMMMSGSLLGVLPLIGIFFLAKRHQ